MKKVFLSILIAAGACAFLNSCSNGDYNADPSGTSGQANPIYNPGGSSSGGTTGGTTGGNGSVALGTFTATVNGSAFSASFTSSSLQQGMLLIDGTSNPTDAAHLKLVGLDIGTYNGVGTYSIGPSYLVNLNGITYDDATAGGVPVGVDTGQIIITVDNSTSYQGTFSGTSTGATGLTITNGKFNVKKQ